MKKLRLITHPNKLLHQISVPINEITPDIKQLAHLMHFYMKEWQGLGLSAVQVGRPIRLVIVNTTKEPDGRKLTMVNPEIVDISQDLISYDEGCLSFPNKFIINNRYKSLTIKYKTLDGEEVVEKLTGITAFCVQHELDHLDGLTMDRFFDRI